MEGTLVIEAYATKCLCCLFSFFLAGGHSFSGLPIVQACLGRSALRRVLVGMVLEEHILVSQVVLEEVSIGREAERRLEVGKRTDFTSERMECAH